MAHFSEKISTLSDTLHSYKIRLWSNYGYGKKKLLSSRKAAGFPENDQKIKGENWI
jgi:hypothetical protein